MIVIGTVAYNSLTADLVRSIAKLPDAWLIVHVHSEDQRIQPAMALIESMTNVSVHNHRSNRGLARSWNDIVEEAIEIDYEALIICNDDIVFQDGDIEKLAEKSMDCQGSYMVSCAGWHEVYQQRVNSHGYSCFALNRISIKEIGVFDENFFPAYFEDNDHHRRATLLGLVEENCDDTNVIHLGSNSIRYNKQLEQQNVQTFVENRNYYMRKWGGTPSKETFNRPFNDPTFGLKICRDKRHTPFGPQYDRTNSSVVSRFAKFV